jgi:transcriptional regulator with XRE-family HTH domain
MVENLGTDAARLGRAVQLRRVALGLKRPALALQARLSYPYVSEIENGLKTPSTKALRQLAEALEMSPAELIALADKLDTSEAPPGSGRWESSVGRFIPGPGTSSPEEDADSRIEAGSIKSNWPMRADRLELSNQQTQILISAVVRAELAAWARTELPALIREWVQQALRDKDK